MFNRLKSRVKEAQDNRKTRSSSSSSAQPFDSGAGAGPRTADAAYGLATAARVALEKHAVRSRGGGTGRWGGHLLTDDQADHFVDPLARFHGCVEAADALAAAAAAGPRDARLDEATGLVDCSVLVSPDGDLLLIPQGADQRNLLLKRRRSRLAPSSGKSPKRRSDADGTTDDADPLNDSGDSASKSMFTELMLNGKDDYESAVFLGYDLHPDSDKALNGFSSRGWSIPATTAALQQTEQSLHDLTQFCEDLVLSQKEFAAKASVCCDKLRVNHPSLGGHAPAVHPVDSDWEIVDPRASDFVMTPGRVGPLLYPGSTLCQAMMAVEHYYSQSAESESERWRMASLQRKGVLPSIRQAYQQFVERSKKRQLALDGASQQARRMEDKLNRLKALSERSWGSVYDAEKRVTARMEELLTERSRAREKERLEKLKIEEGKRARDAKEGSLGTTTEEIWSIVSEVAETMEDGSFEPMDLPSAPLSLPKDKVKEEEGDQMDATMDAADSSEGIKSMPIASREQIETELRLPELRAAAMASDEAVADAADALMNMLSNLDTTRRSAKVAAETNLISACNAQASCLRSLVKLERASLEERLKRLREVEQVIDRIEPRRDLDAYITADKQESGGANHLGEDDDGGVAAALAILSRHVQGNMGAVILRSNQSDQSLATNAENEASAEKIEDAVEIIFKEDQLLGHNSPESEEKSKATEDFEDSIDYLCKAASEMGSSARAKRSKLCYALNSRRGTNAEIGTSIQFDGLCRVFNAILSGCCNEEGGTANAKMCIMLASSFYLADSENLHGAGCEADASRSRDQREFVRNRLRGHPLWKRDDFWDATFGQQITESLTHSGVMANFEKDRRLPGDEAKSEWYQQHKMSWYDLSQMERVHAAAQVHAVVFAQLGALAHSMIELGCGLERSAAFVRRMSIQNQLPISQRTMLLQHLMARDGVERRETQEDTLNMLGLATSDSLDEDDVSPIEDDNCKRSEAKLDEDDFSPIEDDNRSEDMPKSDENH